MEVGCVSAGVHQSAGLSRAATKANTIIISIELLTFFFILIQFFASAVVIFFFSPTPLLKAEVSTVRRYH